VGLSLMGTHLGGPHFARRSPGVAVHLPVTASRIGFRTYGVNGTEVLEELGPLRPVRPSALTYRLRRGRATPCYPEPQMAAFPRHTPTHNISHTTRTSLDPFPNPP
jgi:hypothetical protein